MQNAYEQNKLAALWSVLDDTLSAAFGERSRASAAILLTLHYWPPMSVGELAGIVGLSQPACSRALDRLADEGLVDRSTYEGKEARVASSAAGRRRAQRLQQARLAAAGGMLDALTAAERKQLSGLIGKLLAAPVDGRDYARRACRFCAHDQCVGDACAIGCAASRFDGPMPGARP